MRAFLLMGFNIIISFLPEDANVDVVTVQKLAGHASPETVSIYDRRGEESKRKAVEWLHVPYVSRHPQGE